MATTKSLHSNGGGNAEICRGLEKDICNYYGYIRESHHKAHADAYTTDGKAIQIKTFLENSPSISYKYFKECNKNGIANPTIKQVITQYLQGIAFVICYIDTSRKNPFNAENCLILNQIDAIDYLTARAKLSYDSRKNPQIKLNKNPIK